MKWRSTLLKNVYLFYSLSISLLRFKYCIATGDVPRSQNQVCFEDGATSDESFGKN